MGNVNASDEAPPAYKLTLPLGFTRNRDLTKSQMLSQCVLSQKQDEGQGVLDGNASMPWTPTKSSGVLSPNEFFTPKSHSSNNNNISPAVTDSFSTKFADLVIVCGNDRYEVHKVILCSQSTYFSRMCESTFKEATSNVVDLSDEPAHIVQAMLKYLYGGDIVDPRNEQSLSDKLTFFLDLYTLAHRLMIDELTRDAARELVVAAVSAVADVAFVDICNEIFSRLPEFTKDLRAVMIKIVSQNMEVLLRQTKFQNMLESHPTLAAGALMTVGRSMVSLQCVWESCKGRGRLWTVTDYEGPVDVEKNRCVHCGVGGSHNLKPVHKK